MEEVQCTIMDDNILAHPSLRKTRYNFLGWCKIVVSHETLGISLLTWYWIQIYTFILSSRGPSLTALFFYMGLLAPAGSDSSVQSEATPTSASACRKDGLPSGNLHFFIALVGRPCELPTDIHTYYQCWQWVLGLCEIMFWLTQGIK